MIKDKFSAKKPIISFEVFPPKRDYPVDTIYNTIDNLSDLKPDFISVTYGAAGSTKDKTVEIASMINNKYNLSSLAHLTCIGSTKQEIDNILNNLLLNDVRNILALRGDFPQKQSDIVTNREFKYAKDLILYIKENYNFCVGAACYPEKHIESASIELDVKHLKEKVDVGVDFLITQLFYDNEIFYTFKEKLDKYNINVPVTVGVLPVLNKKQIGKILSLTECTLPKKFTRILEKYEHNPEALKEAGIAYAIEQIIDLLSWGVDGIHIYTMNKSETTRKILSNLSTIRSVLTKQKAC